LASRSFVRQPSSQAIFLIFTSIDILLIHRPCP
jgi:hypothetical protein